MKRIVMLIAMLMLISVNAYAGQKLINITEDTMPEDSYRPVAGKEFLVAVKLVDVDVELNTENPISNEPIIFQASIGTLSETEVTTNIYGEAIAWLTTDTTPDTNHSITASVKNKPEITPINIEVKNIALSQAAPTAEELIQKVEENNDKIQDIKGDITVTSNAPWNSPTKQLKIWQKGEKQKVQEITPNPGIYIRPEIKPITNPTIIRRIVAYNHVLQQYTVNSTEESQNNKFPYSLDYIDASKGVIVQMNQYSPEGSLFRITKEQYILVNNIWISQKETQLLYQGVKNILYQTLNSFSSIQVNTGIPDSEFK